MSLFDALFILLFFDQLEFILGKIGLFHVIYCEYI